MKTKNKQMLYGLILVAGISALGVGCKGNVDYSQTQLANSLVNSLNNDDGKNYSVVKSITLQTDYAVILNNDTGNYIAINLHNYGWGEDGQKYLSWAAENDDLFGNLIDNGDGTFTSVNADGTLGATFSALNESELSSKDLRKIQAAEHDLKVHTLSDKLMANYGFTNPDDARNAASLMIAYQDTQSKREMTNADADLLVKQITGTSLSDAMKAYQSGDSKAMNTMLQQANAKGIGSTPDEAKQAIVKVLGGL